MNDRTKIYLSPVQDFPYRDYKFANSEYNMHTYSQSLTSDIGKNLTNAGFECVKAAPDASSKTRAKEAGLLGCQLYIAIRTAFSYDHTISGTISYYHSEYPASIQLATIINKNLTELCPIPPTLESRIRDGSKIYDGHSSLAQIALPHEAGITPVLIEVNFHDHPEASKWLDENRAEIAESISDEIINCVNSMEQN